MSAVASVLVALNTLANALGWLLSPIGLLPGWLSATVVSVLTGALLLLAFKYTSNQAAIRRVRREIRADLLAVKLFKDDVRIGLRAQRRVLVGAGRLFLLALVPVAAMTVPMVLLLAQLGAWYQAAPLPVGADTTVTVKLSGGTAAPAVELVPTDAVEDRSGPVRVASRGEVCWTVRARQAGYHRLQFRAGGQTVEKELAVGTGVMRVSPVRPARRVSPDLLSYPLEEPLGPDSAVQSVAVEYPARDASISGSDNWIVYWFVVATAAGFCLRGALGVNL
jgi:hypothetical protein